MKYFILLFLIFYILTINAENSEGYNKIYLSPNVVDDNESNIFQKRSENIYEIYVKTKSGDGFICLEKNNEDVFSLPLPFISNGVKRIALNTENNDITILPVDNFCITGSAVGGWDLAGQPMEYVGNGTWNFRGELKGYDTNSDPGRIHFIMNNSEDYKFKRVFGSRTELMENEGEDIPLNPGVYDIAVNMNEMTWRIANGLDEMDSYRITMMGSSVANGVGGQWDKQQRALGYILQYNNSLQERFNLRISNNPFYISNISVDGNNSIDLLNRFDDLERDFGKWVIFGISLGNEGIHNHNNKEPIYNQFKTNLGIIIENARELGKVPIIMNNYTRLDFDAEDYDAIKRMNNEIAFWDVPSINLLGAIDDGAGRWADGCQINYDPFHPNHLGHTELFYSIVPSMMDALVEDKPLQMTRIKDSQYILSGEEVLEFIPDDTVHSFTLAFSANMVHDGIIGRIGIESPEKVPLTIELSDQKILVTLPDKTTLSVPASLEQNEIVISQNYARKYLTLTNNGISDERNDIIPVVPKYVSLGYGESDYDMTLGEVMFYRSSMHTSSPFTPDDRLNKSSLEVYAAVSENPENLALSTVPIILTTNSTTNSEDLTDSNPLNISTKTPGCIEVQSRFPITVQIFNISGQKTASANVSGSYSFNGLASGVYIVNNQKIIVK